MKIEFDAATHRYKLDGKSVPSVTQTLGVLQDFRFVDANVLKRAQDFGNAVHKMVQLWEEDDLDMATVDPALVPYLDGYLLWRSHFAPEIVKCEVVVGHKSYGYAGTLDLLAVKGTRRVLVDVKSGTSKTVGPQTAAYKAAYESMVAERIHERRCLTLTATGPKCMKLDDASDWSLFLSCLNVHNYREKIRAS